MPFVAYGQYNCILGLPIQNGQSERPSKMSLSYPLTAMNLGAVFTFVLKLFIILLIVQETKGDFWLNVDSSVKVFFSTDSCSLGSPLKDSRGCPVISLEHF